MKKTRVFVSSTCYDLHQVRRDLEIFVEGVGYEPVLSDSEKLSIPPGFDNIEACKWLVRESDIMVLIIGGRYGSTDETGKSITNVEYETAFASGMPIYTFVDREVWSKRDSYKRLKEMVDAGSLPIEKLKDALGGKIEDPRVFSFIDQVGSAKRDSWVREFSSASEIVESLKRSWSLLFREMLFERRTASSRLERLTTGPILELKWCSPDEKELPILEVPSFPKIDVPQIIADLKGLKLSSTEFDCLESNEEALIRVLRGMQPKDLGLPDYKWRPEKILELVYGFQERIANVTDLLNRDTVSFRAGYKLRYRALELNLILANSGVTPAVNPVIYLYPAAGVRFMSMEQLVEGNIYVPDSRPKYLNKILEIVSNPLQLGMPSSNLQTQLLEAAARHRSLLDMTGNIFPPHMGSSTIETTLEGDSIRIDIKKQLKHHFTRTLNSTEYFVVTCLKEGEVVEIEYKCYADNLPAPINGTLKLKATERTERN